MRVLVPLLALPFLTACPTSQNPPWEYCAPDESVTLTDTDELTGWGISIADHPLMTGSPFTGTLSYYGSQRTTEATITTAYRDVVIVGATSTQDPDYACEPDVEFTMDLTLKTADGAFDEILVAQLYNVWIDEGTLNPAAVNEAIQGPYGDNYIDDPRGDSFTRLDLSHPPTRSLPISGSVSISFVVPEDEMGISEGVGELRFD